MGRLAPGSRTVLVCVSLFTATALSAQLPNSPTGRMAKALGELAGSEEAQAVEAFAAEHLAAGAAAELASAVAEFYRECRGGEIAGARKTGAASAVLTLELPAGRCEVSYAIQAGAPHRLTSLGLDVSLGERASSGEPVLQLPAWSSSSAESFAAEVGQELGRLAERGELSGVVLLTRDGETVFEGAYGQANREAGLENTTETRFDVGSITKLMTKVAIAQLAQAGKLDLDATLQSLLPDYPNQDVASRITIRQIVDHSSGLGDIFNHRWGQADKSKLVEASDFFPLFSDLPLAFEPGTSQAYSNAGYVVLGAVVEAVSGISYVDYLERHVFGPAGMTSSGFPIRDGKAPDLAIGYTRRDGGELERNLGMLPIRGCPAGSSSHTASDLARLDRALRDGKLLNARWTAWVFGGEERPERDWGIGVAGGGPGVSAVIEADGTSTTVVLSNQDSQVTGQLARQLHAALRR